MKVSFHHATNPIYLDDEVYELITKIRDDLSKSLGTRVSYNSVVFALVKDKIKIEELENNIRTNDVYIRELLMQFASHPQFAMAQSNIAGQSSYSNKPNKSFKVKLDESERKIKMQGKKVADILDVCFSDCEADPTESLMIPSEIKLLEEKVFNEIKEKEKELAKLSPPPLPKKEDEKITKSIYKSGIRG